MHEGELLDVLRRARKTLRHDSFKYEDWTRCTCGHLYRAATGRNARSATEPQEPGGLYLRALRAIAQANALQSGTPHGAVSHATLTGAGSRSQERLRDSAIRLVEKTIAELEAAHEQARLDVIAAAERVVADAEAVEEVAVEDRRPEAREPAGVA